MTASVIALTTGKEGWGLGLYALIPIIWGAARTKSEAFWILMIFYLVASRGVYSGTPVFFGDGHPFFGLLLWITSALTLSLPWMALWSGTVSTKGKFLRLLLILFSISIPPIGLWGWCNPLLSAGYIFPRSGVMGLICMYCLWAALWAAKRNTREIRLAVAAVLVMLALFPRATESPVNWETINTSFGRLYSGSDDTLGVYERHCVLGNMLGRTKLKYVVMPETVAGWWGDNTEELWSGITNQFAVSDRTYFIGAEVTKLGTKKYYNVVQVRGANHAVIAQRIPVPISMYRPWSDTGAIADMFGSGICEIGDQKIGVLICYEPFVFWPCFLTMLSSPDVLVIVSNSWWAKHTNLPVLSDQCSASWALLFAKPIVRAKNL